MVAYGILERWQVTASTLIGGEKMERREPCKKAKDVNSIEELGLSAPAERLVEGMSPEDVI